MFISKVNKVSIEKINYGLNENELGIVFINIDDNNCLLLSLNSKNILYILKYNNYKKILDYVNPLNINIDYIIMNSDYNIEGNKILFNDYLLLNDIIFMNKDYIMISYNDKMLCINPNLNNCNYVYYTYDRDFYFNDNTELFLYNDDINVDKIYNKWVDSYKISNNIYTILKIRNDFEILQIPKNI